LERKFLKSLRAESGTEAKNRNLDFLQKKFELCGKIVQKSRTHPFGCVFDRGKFVFKLLCYNIYMEEYQKRQHKLFEQLEARFKENIDAAETVEPVADYVSDNRICLTSVVFLPEKLIEDINKKIVKEFSGADNAQYFYLPESFHLTIQNIRTINDPPLFTDEDIEKVRCIFREIIPKHKKFLITLKGLFETPTSFSVRGYCGDDLHKLILDLRGGINSVGVPDNKKYGSDEVFFGNVTICRYTKTPNDDFLKAIKKIKNVEIGDLLVDKISLITTNAVAYPGKTKIIEEFYLGGVSLREKRMS
jgi:2'-5' RNA ligase